MSNIKALIVRNELTFLKGIISSLCFEHFVYVLKLLMNPRFQIIGVEDFFVQINKEE